MSDPSAEFLDAVTKVLDAEGARYVEDMRARLLAVRARTGARGPFSANSAGGGGLIRSLQHRVEIGPNGWPMLTVVASPSWRWANRGRGPGRRPPISALERWIKAVGIEPDPIKAKRFAFALANSIAKRGTARPPSFFYDMATPVALDRIDLGIRARIPRLFDASTR